MMTKLYESSNNYLNLFIVNSEISIRNAARRISRLYRLAIKYYIIDAIKFIKKYLQTIKEVLLFRIGFKTMLHYYRR